MSPDGNHGVINHKALAIDVRSLPALAKREMDRAKLPALYQAARKALKQVATIDECKDIADKHSAIAHYAKQIQDKSLLHHAERVYLRAMERLGELLAELPEKDSVETAKKFGVGPTKARWARRIAAIPPRLRDRLIDKNGEAPPSIKALALYGGRMEERAAAKDGLDQRSGSFREFEATQWDKTPGAKVLDAMCSFMLALEEAPYNGYEDLPGDASDAGYAIPKVMQDPRELARRVATSDVAALRKAVVKMSEWLDAFEQALPKAAGK